MISVSKKYKEIMSRPIRNRAFISVGIGVINQNAQENGTTIFEKANWSFGNVFDTNQTKIEYATLDENFMKADGNMLFLPENNGYAQYKNNGSVTNGALQPMRIEFPQVYSIKGITINFGSGYPSEFSLETNLGIFTYSNNAEIFETQDFLGDIDYIVITPISMKNGIQRFRIKSILMGIGLAYVNSQTKDASIEEIVSSISEELPSEKFKFSFYDEERRFDIDARNSFIDFLDTMQKVTLSFGLELV